MNVILNTSILRCCITRMFRVIALMSICLMVGCSSPAVTNYQAELPRLDLVAYFNGHTQGWGMFQKRSGEVVRRFTVEIEGYWEDGQFVLDEHFLYNNGERQQRIWRLTKLPDGRWQGRADDIAGLAEGQQAGNSLHWSYALLLPVDGQTYEMHMDDWMYLIDQQTLINRTAMSKFGFHLGDVTLFFRK